MCISTRQYPFLLVHIPTEKDVIEFSCAGKLATILPLPQSPAAAPLAKSASFGGSAVSSSLSNSSSIPSSSRASGSGSHVLPGLSITAASVSARSSSQATGKSIFHELINIQMPKLLSASL